MIFSPVAVLAYFSRIGHFRLFTVCAAPFLEHNRTYGCPRTPNIQRGLTSNRRLTD